MDGWTDDARTSPSDDMELLLLMPTLPLHPCCYLCACVLSLGSTTSGAYADMMNRLADEHGEQFRPCQLMMDYARQNKKFHS